MAAYIKNTTDTFAILIPDAYGNRKLVFPKNEVTEVSQDDFARISNENGLFKKYLSTNRIVKVSKPEIKKVEDLEVKNKSLELAVKEEKRKTEAETKKVEALEKEILSLKEQLNKKASKSKD